jgi:tetratricopeptide repeat protein
MFCHNVYFTIVLLSLPGACVAHLEDIENMSIRDSDDCVRLFKIATECIAQNQLPISMAYYKKILQYYPNHVDILYNLAYVLRLQGRDAEAIPYYEQILAQDPHHDQAHFGLAKALLATGDLVRGFDEFEWRFVDSPKCLQELGHHAITLAMLQGKRVLIRAEWGLGDTVQFIRYARILKQYGAYVIVQVDAPLIKLFSYCPYLDYIIPVGQELPSFDYQVPLLSLPRLCGTTLETIPAPIPYMYSDPDLQAIWHERLAHDRNFKIGICWQAKPDIFLEHHPMTKRSVPLTLLAELATLEGVSLYSLQQQHGVGQLQELAPEITIHTFDDKFDCATGRYLDTVAVMRELDLIISVDTSVVHVAGALQCPVWVLLPYVAEWRWLHDRTDTPWYPTMTLFRQPMPGDWSSVMILIKQKVNNLLLQQKKGLHNEIGT